jgi:hypothetical protein
MINMLVETTIVIMAVIVILGTGFGIYYYVRHQNKKTDMKIRSLVDQINDTNYYSYKYDKSQEKNIMNLEENITNMNETLSTIKDNVEYLNGNAVTKSKITENLKTDHLTTDEIDIGTYTFSSHASANGNDWLYLYKGGKLNGGVYMDKLKVNSSTELNGATKVNGNVNINGSVNMAKNLVLSGGTKNNWILHTPDDDRTKMYIAPGATSKSWDWDKQFVYEKDGYLSIYGGGLNLRGGTSAYNPEKLGTHFPYSGDGKNHISGDTTIRGDINMIGSIQMERGNPGPMIEKRYKEGDANRYGIGQFENGTMRMYTASHHTPATLNLSLAKTNGQFDDIVKLKTDTTVEVNGMTKFGKPIQTNEIQFSPTNTDPFSIKKVSGGDRSALRVTINDGANETFEIWGDSCGTGNCLGSGRKLASVTGSGLFCLGDSLCMKENKGALQVCDNQGRNCRSVQLM